MSENINRNDRVTKIWRILGEEEKRVREDNPGWELHVTARRVLASGITLAEAREYCKGSLTLARGLKKPIGQGLACMNFGTLLMYEGKLQDAIIRYKDGLKMFEEAGDERLYGIALLCLGMAELERCMKEGVDGWKKVFIHLKQSEAILEQTDGRLLVEVQNELENANSMHRRFLAERSRRDVSKKAKEVPKKPSQAKIGLFPIVGRVAAGQPIFAEQNIEGYVSAATVGIDDQMYTIVSLEGASLVRLRPAARHFILQVKGSSMIDAGILNGDYVLIREQKKVEQGEIAVVQVEGLETEATLKRYYRERDHIRLQPENNNMEPITIAAEEATSVVILGKPLAVLKRST